MILIVVELNAIIEGIHFQNHPAVQNHLGHMLVGIRDFLVLAVHHGDSLQPDWCTFQKWSGDVVFVNMGMLQLEMVM